ncbi:zinc-finger-containing protein [Fimbriiglobus ruber]|uniref:zinc-finger-containing protein n=1 Tax=Fimbriiglobus ruber TaxID=1908690 RepID=UPI000B4B5882|nr:zinc-finger-containing protein [Fimbriiglobus ruber]
MSLFCPYCGSGAKLVLGRAIYADRWPNLSDKAFWACERYPTCDAYVGCHPGTETPLGRLANKELRGWKLKAHNSFDPLWKAKLAKRQREQGPDPKIRARGTGYQWLAGQLGIPVEQCHIGLFDADTCRRVVTLCEPYARRLHSRRAA